ncbi:uncharacterized protein ACLA_035330 [Aspergillus clavatus NRRL 1]|uniref:Uncharacterized protein n=1 Tax=Aspergillus clavatus (strain ATCC 1007 / CBS 513.65 / DSM 816 / NCTC 3887 / NRRL 1 / QM 1276 / 107) TaxID=344612 RepID=A1CJK6_ASPCL|nr:uncharacterized protein ACLA_035330 [Aspergillus clavatus NRRL 1]EAW09330.1 conserved hypothetical protein [Aspergillus clavatus NRRL 1]
MARPFQTPYEPEFEKLSSPRTNSPSAPFARSETPVSFKTNVNRSKTKRWVEAKKYSYDGNDWGDDEYGEYDDDEPLPVPPASSFSQSTNDLSKVVPRNSARPPLPSMDRSRSMDHVAILGVGLAGSRSRSVEGNTAQAPADSAASDKSLPFVRPADLYKRMQESRRQDSSHHFARSQTEPISQSPPPGNDQGLPETQEARPHGSEHANDDRLVASTVPPKTENDTPTLELPNVKRLSGFDADFVASDPNTHGRDAEATPQDDHNLQHNPSLGFRSVVHQAFDVPETPISTVDSVARSNSDGTSVISLVVGNRGPNEDQTPTIVEEPGEVSTPRDAPDSNLVFKPGHRWDMSLPSPNNSPSRQPIITSPETTAPSMLGEMSSETPTDSTSSFHQPLPHRASVQLPPAAALPAPLNISSTQTLDSSAQQPGVPVIIPSISTENSPQDTESDRLRKEIIRSLSRENTPGAEPQQQDEGFRPQATRQDTEISQQDSLIPSEYERYWSEQAESSPQELRPPVPGYSHAENTSQDLYASSPMIAPAPAPAAQLDSQPKLKRRFSWETSSSGDEVPAVDLQSISPSAVPVPGQFPPAHDSTTELASATVPDAQAVVLDRDQPVDHQLTPEKPKLTIVPPAAMDDSSIAFDGHLPEVADRQSTEVPRSPAAILKVSPSVEPTLLGFRDILGIKSSDERVRAFDRTRDQFATIDTGLQNWLQIVVRAHPEHMDVVEQSTKASSSGPKAAVTNRKFPKLSSLGHFVSHQEGPPSGSGHVRRPSAPLGSIMNKQQVEQRGKDLLHTAGALGGRAGEAAKGLFAKGRNKLKGGGSDKVDA